MPRPARPWFRFYSELLESRKAQTLGRQDPALFFHWVNMLCLANLTEPRGHLPPLHDIAFALRMQDDDAQVVIDELIRRRFVSKDGRRYRMHDWDDWQKKSDAYQTQGRRERHADGTRMERGWNTNGTHREEKEKEKEIEKSRGDARTRHADPLDQIAADFATFGAVNASTARLIDEAVQDYGLEPVQDAVKKAQGSGAEGRVPWNYIVGILEGKGESARNGHRVDATPGLTASDRAEIERSGALKPAIVHLD